MDWAHSKMCVRSMGARSVSRRKWSGRVLKRCVRSMGARSETGERSRQTMKNVRAQHACAV